jgi:hypothetical protein
MAIEAAEDDSQRAELDASDEDARGDTLSQEETTSEVHPLPGRSLEDEKSAERPTPRGPAWGHSGSLVFTAVVSAALGAGGGYVAKRQAMDETRFLNFDAESTASERLDTGWSTFEVDAAGNTFVWCVAERCTLSVLGSFEGRQLVRLRSFPFRYPDAPPQSAVVSVNGQQVATVELRDDPHVVEVPTEAGVWHRGKNTITFEFAYAESPLERIPGSEDPRRLSVAFDWLQVINL